LSREALVRDRVIAEDLAYSAGALGCALSHRALWQSAARGRDPITVCEDDAILHRDFEAKALALMDRLPPGWDAIVWGWNFDASIAFELLPDLARCAASFEPSGFSDDQLAAFPTVDVDPRGYRLLRSFGAACYTISPEGGRWLDADCFPLRPFLLPIGNQLALRNVGIDVAMADAYPRSNVWVSIPPLAIARNDRSASTIGRGRER
jgi:glycosyl transferase, family 25